ncbi:hypothetical protein [Mesorhizobium sp.]|uniref:hypothetical protein n=1 Tax=Mesorhizobium sp. TaxID=1871066 RepID=UPI000FE8754C|nr:hypothetical protein [Mesorhizobium sp.]RWA84908.1 MAG: hypothetical protein EOQ32_26665 [Mesorhizobium sp.]TIW51842.1 MAG: hypothetical protein E5V54_32380 [Mesorhizobium sp.]TIW76601.1 MAG: hypothetical protein E5V53_27925 [Mesorhizobium sp.]
MPLSTYTLAEDQTGAWKLAFEPEELHLYIAFAKPGSEPDPVAGMTAEDFLVTIPRGPLHRQAHEGFVRFLTASISRC